MRTLRIPLRVVFYKEDGDWIAHCLEFDICGDGSSKVDALDSLSEGIRLQVEKSIEFSNWDNLFTPAEPEICERFFAGRDIAEGELKFHVESHDPVVFQQTEYREYDPATDRYAGRDLVEA
ncbi:MAG TPA: hypothetical protein VG826_04085 [Pirellulales bacterium]|nr:hypothetical protein [Pirellulales bacterium]